MRENKDLYNLRSQFLQARDGSVVRYQGSLVTAESVTEHLGHSGLDVVGAAVKVFTDGGHHPASEVSQSPVIVVIRSGAELSAHNAGGDGWDELVKIFLQVQGLILKKRLDHPHEVDEDGEVMLDHINSHALSNEGTESR